MSEEEIQFVKVDALKPSLRNVNVTLKVVDIGEPRSVTSRRNYSVHRVAEALVEDETGCVLLTLQDDQVSGFTNGDVIEVKNGYTSLFSGFLRLNIGSARQQRVLNQLYLVFMCPRCGSLRYAREGQKTALCFKCGYRVSVDPFKIRILFKTARIEEAIAALEKYKMKRGKKRSRPA